MFNCSLPLTEWFIAHPRLMSLFLPLYSHFHRGIDFLREVRHTRTLAPFLCFTFLLFLLLVVSTLQITLLLCALVEIFVSEIPAFTSTMEVSAIIHSNEKIAFEKFNSNSVLVSNSQTLLWTVFIVTSELSTKEIQ